MEVDIMKKLSHENVIHCIDVPPELEGGRSEMPLMAMEFCSGGDLRKVNTRGGGGGHSEMPLMAMEFCSGGDLRKVNTRGGGGGSLGDAAHGDGVLFRRRSTQGKHSGRGGVHSEMPLMAMEFCSGGDLRKVNTRGGGGGTQRHGCLTGYMFCS